MEFSTAEFEGHLAIVDLVLLRQSYTFDLP